VRLQERLVDANALAGITEIEAMFGGKLGIATAADMLVAVDALQFWDWEVSEQLMVSDLLK
jgi:hypothetical protein